VAGKDREKAVRYWLDTEFIDDGKTIDLISIGIVAENGSELYLQSCEFDHRKASEWVKENVLAHLVMCRHTEHYRRHEVAGLYRTDRAYHAKFGGQCSHPAYGPNGYAVCPWRTREQIKSELIAFFDPEKYGKPEIWGWCSGYDWVAFCQLFGAMMELPADYPHYMCDIQQVLDTKGITDDQLPKQQGQAHDALEDAQHIKTIWRWLQR
jgi:hypothetical protein